MRVLSILFIALGFISITSASSMAHRAAAPALKTSCEVLPVWNFVETHNYNASICSVDLHGYLENNVLINYLTMAVDTPLDSTYLGDSLRNAITNSQDTGSYSSGIHSNYSSGVSSASSNNTSDSILPNPSFDNQYVVGVSVSGNGSSGVISINSADSAGEGHVTITFDTTFAKAPVIVVSPASSNAKQGSYFSAYYVVCNTNSFSLYVEDNGSATSNAKFNYVVLH